MSFASTAPNSSSMEESNGAKMSIPNGQRHRIAPSSSRACHTENAAPNDTPTVSSTTTTTTTRAMPRPVTNQNLEHTLTEREHKRSHHDQVAFKLQEMAFQSQELALREREIALQEKQLEVFQFQEIPLRQRDMALKEKHLKFEIQKEATRAKEVKANRKHALEIAEIQAMWT